MPLYALNLFDLADSSAYRDYSRRSRAAVERHGGRIVALGRSTGAVTSDDTDPRQVLILVEWRSREAFNGFLSDPELADLHPLREEGTQRYLWWLYEKLDDLRPLFAEKRKT